MPTKAQEEQALEILNNLGYECYKNEDYLKAIIYYERYLKLNPENHEIYNMIGYIHKLIGAPYENIENQIKYYEKALELKPDYQVALRNLTIAYQYANRYKDALDCFEKLLKLNPIVDDYLAYAFLQLQLGNFDEGWKYYEYRFLRKHGPIEYPKIEYRPKWEGQPIKDKTLLVHYEQGYGDSIQFFRYLEEVKPFAKKIIFRTQDELVDLFNNAPRGIEIYGISTPVEDLDFDYHISLMSLPYVLNSSPNNIPLSEGYIKSNSELEEKYKKEYFDNDCFKVGITWNGRKFGNRERNIPLKYFYPLAKLKNVKLYSFQKGFGIEQLEDLPKDIEIISLGETFTDFSRTAAAMANVDVFITGDNCVFNLAGAMGKKTFLLLNKYSEWRWFLDDEKTPWYNSVKIFKKNSELDSWSLLFDKILKNLSF